MNNGTVKIIFNPFFRYNKGADKHIAYICISNHTWYLMSILKLIRRTLEHTNSCNLAHLTPTPPQYHSTCLLFKAPVSLSSDGDVNPMQSPMIPTAKVSFPCSPHPSVYYCEWCIVGWNKMPADRSWRKTLATRGEAVAWPMAGCSMQQRGGEPLEQHSSELTYLHAYCVNL